MELRKLVAGGSMVRLWVMLIALGTGAFWGCTKDTGGELLENEPPIVWLSSAPPEGDATRYKLKLYWGGWDPDGEISHYEYVITSNEGGIFDPADTTTSPDGVSPWHQVTSNDSVFTFSADVWADSSTTDLVTRFERSHTFFIRAVDEQGLASVEPAYRSFTSWTLSPSVGIGAALVPSIATYRWRAQDYINATNELQEPDSVRWILHSTRGTTWEDGFEYVRTHPDSPEWSPWSYYRAPQDSGKSWTTPPTDVGTYVFAVQAKDEAGAVTPVFDERYNLRKVQVAKRSSGPQLYVFNQYIGTIVTSVTNKPPVIIDMPAGVPMQFTFWGDAEQYGGLVMGYRYGWDISDLSDPSQWEISYTPFTGTGDRKTAKSPSRTFYFGTHTFDVEIKDSSGFVSLAEIKVNVVQFTMQRPLLHVDDFNPKGAGLGPTHGLVPDDAEQDAFWKDVLSDINGFSWEDDAIQVVIERELPIVKIGMYKNLIWDTWGGYDFVYFRPKIYSLIAYRPGGEAVTSYRIQPNVIALFMRAGGHVMICGRQPLSQAINSYIYLLMRKPMRYPFILRYELGGDQDGNYSDQIQQGEGVGEESFGYKDACVNVIDFSYTGAGQIRNTFDNGCGVERLRVDDNFEKNYGMRQALPLEPNVEGFPLLELRREVSEPTLAFAPDKKGLNAEVYNPPYFDFCSVAGLKSQRPCFEPIYGMGCLGGESVPIYNAPVAFWNSTYANVVPDQGGGVAARSIFLGFEPFYMKPEQVKEMIDIIAFDEWQLQPR